MRRIVGGVLVVLACLFVLAAMAGSAGQPEHRAATSGALLLAVPAIGFGAWLAFVPRRRRGGASRRPRWHVAATVLLGAFGLAGAALSAVAGEAATAVLLLTVPAGAVLWWVATHYTDAPPRPTVVDLPDGVTEPALLYEIPRSKQLALGAATLVGLGACSATAAVLRAEGRSVWIAVALGAVGCLVAAARWVGPTDPDAGLALSRTGVSVRQRGRLVLVPWDALDGAEVVAPHGGLLAGTRSLGLSVSDPDRVRGLGPGTRRLVGASPGLASSDLVWATWLFDTDARNIADHIELLLEEAEMRAAQPAMWVGADDVP